MPLKDCAVLSINSSETSQRRPPLDLAPYGCRVLEAATRRQALRIAAAERLDFVLLDGDASDPDDATFCSHLKANPAPPTILKFSLPQEPVADRIKRLADGVDALVSTEAGADELVGTMAALLRLRQAEQTIAEREERLRLAIDAAKMSTWDWDIVNDAVEWSDNLEVALRMAPGSFDCTIEAFRELVHPDDRARVDRALGKAFAGETDYDIEFRMLRADGTVRWTATKGTILRAPDGRPLRMVGVDVDITERKEAEAALGASDLRFRAVFDGAFQFTGLLTPDGILLEANNAALAFIGATRDAVVGKPFWETPGWTQSESLSQRLRQSIAEAAMGNFVRYEVEIRGADGRVAAIDFSLRPVRDETGRVAFLIPEGREITERQRMERALRDKGQWLELAHEAAGIAVWDWNLATNQAVWSKEFHQLFGFNPDEVEPGYAAFRARVHPDDLAPLEAHLREIIDAGEPFDAAFRIARPDGVRWMLGRGRLILGEDGVPVRMIGINMDITAQKAIEAALRQQNALIAAASEEKRLQLTSTVHDLRQPLQAILLSLELMQSAVRNSPHAARLERAVRVASRMNEELDNLLTAARLESGVVEPNIRVFPLDRVLALIDEAFDEIARSKELLLVISRSGASIRSDPDLLLKMLGNLVGNALKFTERGSVTLTTLRVADQITVEIRDTGAGIPEAALASIWDEYSQVAPDQRGVGLGLSIVRRVAKLLGHTVTVRSKLGVGTSFSVVLPVADEVQASGAETAPPAAQK
jgi:PAS domain S-box-containing protein